MLTQWFPKTLDPVRVGVYLTYSKTLHATFFNYWDGEHWHGGYDTADEAFSHRSSQDEDEFDNWCGLPFEAEWMEGHTMICVEHPGE